jgi:hypothetical protein
MLTKVKVFCNCLAVAIKQLLVNKSKLKRIRKKFKNSKINIKTLNIIIIQGTPIPFPENLNNNNSYNNINYITINEAIKSITTASIFFSIILETVLYQSC